MLFVSLIPGKKLRKISIMSNLELILFFCQDKGKDPATKSGDFLEQFQTAFGPPPLIFGKLFCNFFVMDMVAFMQGGIGQIVSVNIS